MKQATMAGYSGTPLARKLGLKVGGTLVAVGAPEGYRSLLEPLPDASEVREVAESPPDGARLVHAFFTSRERLVETLPSLRGALDKTGALWISWPKKSAGVPTDLTREVVREEALAAGLVDVKVCAVDATWSALRMVFRLRDR